MQIYYIFAVYKVQNTMLEKELHLERDFFFFLNGSHSTFGDNFFYICSCPLTWLIFYLCILWVFTYKKNWKEIVCVLIAVSLLILFCDKISSDFFKYNFHRFRPTHHPDFMYQVKTVYGYLGGSYGFISGHATNMFGLAAFLALIFRNKFFTLTIFLFATLIAYSRIYLGVHFVSDVVVGAIVGTLIAGCIYVIYNNLRRNWFSIDSNRLEKPVCSIRKTGFLCGVFYLHVIILLLFNSQIITILLHNK